MLFTPISKSRFRSPVLKSIPSNVKEIVSKLNMPTQSCFFGLNLGESGIFLTQKLAETRCPTYKISYSRTPPIRLFVCLDINNVSPCVSKEDKYSSRRGVAALNKRSPASLYQRRMLHDNRAWSGRLANWSTGQRHLLAPLDLLEAQERAPDLLASRLGEVEFKKATEKEDGIQTFLSQYPPPKSQTSGLLSNILTPPPFSTLLGPLTRENVIDNALQNSFSKILSPHCQHGVLVKNHWPYQKPVDGQDNEGNFQELLTTPGKRDTEYSSLQLPRKRQVELMLEEIGAGRGLFSNILRSCL